MPCFHRLATRCTLNSQGRNMQNGAPTRPRSSSSSAFLQAFFSRPPHSCTSTARRQHFDDDDEHDDRGRLPSSGARRVRSCTPVQRSVHSSSFSFLIYMYAIHVRMYRDISTYHLIEDQIIHQQARHARRARARFIDQAKSFTSRRSCTMKSRR